MSSRRWPPASRTWAGPNEGGTSATEFAAGIALLVMPVTVLVASLPTWTEHRLAARVAVAEAARAVAVATDLDAGTATGRAVADDILRNRRVASHSDVTFTGSFVPDGTVTATLRVDIPGLSLPFVGPIASWSYTATHTEHLEPYRSSP